MGLSSYGKDSSIPSILNTPISTSFKTKPSMGIIMGEYIHPLKDTLQNKKNLAWRIQSDTQQLVGDYIEKSLKETGLKQVCCAGGYFLNCVANYYLIKRFPDVEFYFEPIAHDGGTSIGAAFYKWYEYSKSTNIISQKTLYHGPKYSKKELLTKIKNFINGI
jgi:carbamoyltransferase